MAVYAECLNLTWKVRWLLSVRVSCAPAIDIYSARAALSIGILPHVLSFCMVDVKQKQCSRQLAADNTRSTVGRWTWRYLSTMACPYGHVSLLLFPVHVRSRLDQLITDYSCTVLGQARLQCTLYRVHDCITACQTVLREGMRCAAEVVHANRTLRVRPFTSEAALLYYTGVHHRFKPGTTHRCFPS